MNKKPLIVTLASLAIAGSLIWIYLKVPSRPAQIQFDPYRALGSVAAEETGRLLHHKGQVVVIARENPAGANPVQAAELKAFADTLQKGGVRVAATETFRVAPMEQMLTGGSVPRDRFLQMLQAHPDAGAFVLFAGFPILQQPDLDSLKQSATRFVLISGDRTGSKALLDAGRVHLAIVPRLDAPAQSPDQPKSLREWFDRQYVVLTGDKPSG